MQKNAAFKTSNRLLIDILGVQYGLYSYNYHCHDRVFVPAFSAVFEFEKKRKVTSSGDLYNKRTKKKLVAHV